MSNVINYRPPPTVAEFMRFYLPGKLFQEWIVGPLGSGKTTGLFFKLVYMAGLQAPGPDGIRRSRAVIVRNTFPMLRDTTLKSWDEWFQDGVAGKWIAGDRTFVLRFGDVECEVLFRPLDTPDDVRRVLSLEVTFAIIDEFVEIPRAIVDALLGRCGRYPSSASGGATNWGMWGSSNPSSEDNWWYEYLHNQGQPGCLPTSGKYLLQPDGLGPDAENIEHLPGKREYYTNQAEGKSETWINQFLRAQWGFSIAGRPVVSSFSAETHVRRGLLFNPALPLVAGFDPGFGGSAMIFTQEDLAGRLNVLGEIVASQMGATRFIAEKLKPYLRRRFPELDPDMFIIAPDPAAANRTATDEKAVVDVIKKQFRVSIESNNRLPLRLDAIEHFTTRLVEGKPALAVDADHCPVLVRALKGGWRYALNSKEEQKAADPEKNSYSHPGDSFGYACRYWHKGALKLQRYSSAGAKPFVPPKFGNNYVFR